MSVGLDARHFPPEIKSEGPHAVLEHASALHVDGVFFRTVFDISPSLDLGLLKEVRADADSRGLYLEAGLGKVNPFATCETPELRASGDGDILLGARRVLEAAAHIGVSELWAGTANYKAQYDGILGFDRFRTDVDWGTQLEAIADFLGLIAPIARDLGIHVNLETHEEITSFELVRIIEQVGPDAIGIVFDTANVLHRVEHPVQTTKRLAPYVRQTHLKDAALRWVPRGVEYQLRPCGTGVVDFEQIIPLLLGNNPTLNLSLECDDVRPAGQAPMTMLVELTEPKFYAGHPDLTPSEFLAYSQMVDEYAELTRRGERETFEGYGARAYGLPEWNAYSTNGAAYISQIESAVGRPIATNSPLNPQSV